MGSKFVTERQTEKLFDTIYGGMQIFLPVKFATRFARRGITVITAVKEKTFKEIALGRFP